MERMVAYCGIVCTECPAYIATRNDDDQRRKKVAEEWSKMFDAEIKPESINCDGCLSPSERQIDYCRTCEIRKCGLEKNVLNCAHCEEYICEKLGKFFENAPNAKANLAQIRENLEGKER